MKMNNYLEAVVFSTMMKIVKHELSYLDNKEYSEEEMLDIANRTLRKYDKTELDKNLYWVASRFKDFLYFENMECGVRELANMVGYQNARHTIGDAIVSSLNESFEECVVKRCWLEDVIDDYYLSDLYKVCFKCLEAPVGISKQVIMNSQLVPKLVSYFLFLEEDAKLEDLHYLQEQEITVRYALSDDYVDYLDSECKLSNCIDVVIKQILSKFDEVSENLAVDYKWLVNEVANSLVALVYREFKVSDAVPVFDIYDEHSFLRFKAILSYYHEAANELL